MGEDSNSSTKMAKVFYLHIPKTGGQTLAMRMGSAFPLGKANIIGPDLAFPDGTDELQELLAANDFVERHVTGPVLQDFQDLSIVTTIREPVAQIVSNYLHITREPSNFLHRAASLLTPREFFSSFGDILADHQTRYLISAFFEAKANPDPWRGWCTMMFNALDRIQWVVPTESIDEFMTLWSLESGRQVFDNSIVINTSRRDSRYEELRALVQGMPNLFSIDLLLWQSAKRRFSDYREKVLQKIVPFGFPDYPGRAYWRNSSGIWLQKGWYLPQVGTPSGTAWWAGPGRFSSVLYRRKNGERYLKFAVVVVCGVPHSNILVLGRDQVTQLPMAVQEVGSGWMFWVDLDTLPEEGTLWLWVPEVWSPVMVDGVTDDTTRKSFGACDWELVGDAPTGLAWRSDL